MQLIHEFNPADIETNVKFLFTEGWKYGDYYI